MSKVKVGGNFVKSGGGIHVRKIELFCYFEL